MFLFQKPPFRHSSYNWVLVMLIRPLLHSFPQFFFQINFLSSYRKWPWNSPCFLSNSLSLLCNDLRSSPPTQQNLEFYPVLDRNNPVIFVSFPCVFFSTLFPNLSNKVNESGWLPWRPCHDHFWSGKMAGKRENWGRKVPPEKGKQSERKENWNKFLSLVL